MHYSDFSFLNAYPSLEKALIEVLGVSHRQIKRSGLSKKELSKSVEPRMSVKIPLPVTNWKEIYPEYVGPEIEIIFEDHNILVINKPPDINSHPLNYNEKDNCLSFLRSTGRGKLLEVNRPRHERGLLARLDFGTSGVLCYIKNAELFFCLRENFHQLVKEKIYLAIVENDCNLGGNYRHYFRARGPAGERMELSSKPFLSKKEGMLGELKIEKLNYNRKENLSLLQVELFSGLRHQIRAQLAYLGFPILGDTFYGGKSSKRLFLHAYKYSIKKDDMQYQVIAKKMPLFGEFFGFDSGPDV